MSWKNKNADKVFYPQRMRGVDLWELATMDDLHVIIEELKSGESNSDSPL